MTFLSVSDKKACGLVNRVWREASLAPRFLDEQVTVIGPPQHDCLSHVIRELKYSTRPFYHFIFKEIEVTQEIPIWNQLCSQMRSLTLIRCDLSEKTLVDTLKHCDNLRALCINACQECLMSGRLLDDGRVVKELSEKLGKLCELSLAYNRYLSDALFNRLIAICPNLASLSLMGCQISFHGGLYKKFYPNGDIVKHGSESVLTFLNILRYITRQAKKLKHLNFSYTLIDGTALTTLSAQEHLKLETLQLQGCDQLTLNGIRGLTEHQIYLKTLDISFCSRITDATLICICKNLVKLECLKIRRCRAVTNVGVQHTQLLKSLKDLDISDCEQLNGACFTVSLSNDTQSDKKILENRNLRELAARALSLDEKAIEYITISFSNLRLLDVGYCFIAITDRTVQMILKELVLLRILKLCDCVRISDAGLTGMGMSTSNDLNKYDIQDIPQVTEPQLRINLRSWPEEEIARVVDREQEAVKLCENISKPRDIITGLSLLRLTGLQQLDLSGCNQITDISLKHAFAFSDLQVLNLSRCQQITQVGLEFLANNNPAIEILDLSECHNIMDEGVSVLAQNLHRLIKLHLQGCSRLTSFSLDHIRLYCKNIQYLDVRRCRGINVASLESLADFHVEYTRHTEDNMIVQNRVPPPTAIPIRR